MEQGLYDFLGQKRAQKVFPNILKDEFLNQIIKQKIPQFELT